MLNDDVYDKLALQRVNKCWRHYKHTLKKTNFKSSELTVVQHYDKIPPGHSRGQWKNLVNFWFSENGKKLSRLGKQARASQNQFHTMGSNSYANLRADYEEEHNEKISMIELWEQGYKRKDGTFLKGTVTEDFLTDAKARAEWLKNADADGSKSTIEIENEAFEVELNGIDDIHDQQPQGYGFGVKRSDVYGVRGLLRKEGYGKYGNKPLTVDDNARVNALNKKNEELEKKNKSLSKKVEENTKLTKMVLSQFSLLLDAIRDGKASTEHLDAAQTALHMANPEDHEDADGAEFETEDFPSSPGD